MDNSLIPADDGVWDELQHQQSREIQQHLSSTQQTSFLLQTVEAIKSAAMAVSERAAMALPLYKPIEDETNLDDFGIPNEDPLLPGLSGYEEFPQQTQGGGSFIFLDQFRLPRRQQDTWGAVSNLDLFFGSLYNYYYHRGLTPILGKGIADLVSLFVTLWLSIILFAYVDWWELAKCTDEHTCKDTFREYMVARPFSHFSLWNCVVILYCLLFFCYSLFAVWSFWTNVQEALRAKEFFRERLGISQSKLEGGGVDWDRDVVAKLIELQEGGEYRITIHGQGTLDSLVIAQRILRKENFLVSFFNRGLLDLQLPWLQQTFFCKSLEWSIYFCVLNYMFNHKFQIRPAFYLDPAALQRRFLLCGIAHAIFLPFLAFFMVLHFLMQNVYDWKSTKQYLGPKEWSMTAKWTFREFNELPHFFERRLGPSYEATEEYIQLFKQSEIVTTIGRILAFLGGSFGAVLLVFATVNDAILLHVKIGHFNLLWFVGIAAALYSTGKGMLPNPKIHSRYVRNLFADADKALEKIASYTHHYPDSWKGRGYNEKTKKLVTSMFNNKAVIFAYELVSLIVAPIILCYSLPRCAEHICEFVMTVKVDVPGAGDLCGYCTFDFDEFSDFDFEGKAMGRDVVRGDVAASVAELHDVEAATRQHPKPRAYYGKMEKSFFSFKTSHPNWKSTKSGQSLVDRIELFKENETKMLAAEQQQHMQAAARQLDTLRRLEERSNTVSPVMAHLDESYIGAGQSRSPQSGADSGGGVPLSPIASLPPVQTSMQPRYRESASTPPPFAGHDPLVSVRQAPRSQVMSTSRSVLLDYNDIGLSTEPRHVLHHSMLDPNLSVTASALGGAYGHPLSSANPLHEQYLAVATAAAVSGAVLNPEEQQRIDEERQYLWLQRYHLRTFQERQQVQQTQRTRQATADVSQSMYAGARNADHVNNNHDPFGHQSVM